MFPLIMLQWVAYMNLTVVMVVSFMWWLQIPRHPRTGTIIHGGLVVLFAYTAYFLGAIENGVMWFLSICGVFVTTHRMLCHANAWASRNAKEVANGLISEIKSDGEPE